MTAAASELRGRGAARFARIVLLGGMLVGLGLWAADWMHDAVLYVHETDARISADMVSVSSRVAGRVIERPIRSGSVVTLGDTLAVIDDRVSQTLLDELLAELDRIDAEMSERDAEITMIDQTTKSRYASEQARLAAAQALVEAVEVEFNYAKLEFKRAETLATGGVVSIQRLDKARNDYLTTQKELVSATAQVATAQAMLGEAQAARREIDLIVRERETLIRRKAEVRARIERQQIDIADRVIASPLQGVVSRAFVEVGEYIQPGQRIALVHDPRKIYVEANIRETDIARLSLEQTVRLEVDAYPEMLFEGRIKMIGAAATSVFALLPNPNPSGNFTKVTQRLPVRISVDQVDGMLRPGMMVEVFILIDEDASSPLWWFQSQ
ncbi:MAG: HlyD family secretion protein [Alphaproteobacteria bacterium]|jgi:membrane fusion protein (multidrug efflux system)